MFLPPHIREIWIFFTFLSFFSGSDFSTKNTVSNPASIEKERKMFLEDGTNHPSEISENYSLDCLHFSRGLLKKKFNDRNLENLYWKYGIQIHRGYFSRFLFVQTVLTVAHIAYFIVYNINGSPSYTLADIVGYLGIEVLLCFFTVFALKKGLVKKYKRLPHFASALTVGSIILVDVALQIYHTANFHSRYHLRPAHYTHALIACHIFFPLEDNTTPIVMGVLTILVYFTDFCFVTYRNMDDTLKKALSNAIFLICMNLLGMYFRYINEIFIRSSFLDKRACVESTLKLKYEKEREEQLMLSILPRHFALRLGKDIYKNLAGERTKKQIVENPHKELYVERYDDVSILYADVVNYTKMTSSLPVNRLVEILNELFGKFDEASERHRVLRIKFLGDCYYCVSGVPHPNPDHAKSCVDLALEMINIIKDVREANNLNIDMRIGIHSGSILSGILGTCKWQYDIWSKDVIIANHMEQSGRSGMVHITKQTLEKLGTHYNVEPFSGDLRDELLSKCKIQTYFIIPESKANVIPSAGIQTSIMWRIPSGGEKYNRKKYLYESKKNENLKQHGIDTMYSQRRVISGTGHLLLSRRRGESNLIMNQQTLKMADINMEKDIENLDVGKLNFCFGKEKVHFLCLTFNDDVKWEKSYLREPDHLFRYYVAASFLVFLSILFINSLNFISWSFISYTIHGISLLVLIISLSLTWIPFFLKSSCNSRHLCNLLEPKNVIVKFFHYMSVEVTQNVILRIKIYVAIIVSLALCALSRLLEVELSSSDVSLRDSKAKEFLNPWEVTECCTLVIFMSFLFFRIHFQLKLIIASSISVFYIYFVLSYKDVFNESDSCNPDMPSITSHIFIVLLLVLELHLVDRQTEYMGRMDYCWKKQLIKEKEEVAGTRSMNKELLQHILPIHVAKIYLDPNRSSDDLYHENYSSVTVMFASLTNYSLYSETDTDQQDSETRSLRILNRIICNFDETLLIEEYRRIEKIKVAGWSYMAACGLAPGSRNSAGLTHTCNKCVTLTMAKFAAEMMRILKKINEENCTNFGLRVGISHGPVTAGVVGSQRPYYDIWGNTVNVASRMDSTGEDGKIQVPESTAKILIDGGINCQYRGIIFVKGKGDMETYYVKLTEDCFLENISDN